MIELPKRSVTRFFIPLIDVMTLLFCIYLLMPIVKGTGESAEGDTGGGTGSSPLTEGERQELERLRQEVKKSDEQWLERMRREKTETLQRLAIRVLEIDAETGKLFYYDPDRLEILNEASARSLIERQKREADGRELYYLFLYPRKITGFPEQQQVKQYERWFAGVAHGMDNPQASR